MMMLLGKEFRKGGTALRQNKADTMWGYFTKCLKHYADFRGRASRKEFWSFVLF